MLILSLLTSLLSHSILMATALWTNTLHAISFPSLLTLYPSFPHPRLFFSILSLSRFSFTSELCKTNTLHLLRKDI